MANSKYEYVRAFEQPDSVLPNTWIVVRIDGRGFTKFTTKHKFVKPNDRRALDLMNKAAEAVMRELPDLVLAYGNSDEFSFVFHKDCALFERRASKLTTTIVSTFTSYYTFWWPEHFPDSPLTPPLPTFDGRAVCYPSDQNLRDYMSWRQVDCHINNLYNTTFWALVQQGGMEARAAEVELSGTVSSDKNEILFSRFRINYNNEPEIFKKGSVLYRDFFPVEEQEPQSTEQTTKTAAPVSHPQPQRSISRAFSQPLTRISTDLMGDSSASGMSTPRGPTFLSTSTTPSPPPSPSSMSQSLLAFTYPQAISHHSERETTPPECVSMHRHNLSNNLVPIPIPPPTLRPSTRPPPYLRPPNPSNYMNTSRQAWSPAPNISQSFTAMDFGAPKAPPATSVVRPNSSAAMAAKPGLKHRSPSLSQLDAQNPPIIPLRISSIPTNNKPRKLSLQSQKSLGMLRSSPEEKENLVIPARPRPMSTMKELPSPSTTVANNSEERPHVLARSFSTQDTRTQQRRAPKPQPTNILQTPTSPENEDAFLWSPTPPTAPRPRAQSHSRITSAPAKTSFSFPSPPPHTSRSEFTFAEFSDFSFSSEPAEPSSNINPAPEQLQPSALPQEKQIDSHSKPAKPPKNKSARSSQQQQRGNDRAPKEMSKTQRDKERKKRTKARIVCEHVDLIRDEFWLRRPWILSGKAG